MKILKNNLSFLEIGERKDMKKIVKISLVFMIIFGMISNVYAASCTITAKPSKAEVTSNEEVVVDFVLSNIQDEKGMITFTAKLEHDSGLTFKKIEGQNGWKPSFSQNTKLIAAERDGGYTKSDEVVFRVTFQANGAVNTNPKVTLTDIVFSNGNEDIDVKTASTTIKIVEPSNPGGNPGGSQGGSQGGNQGGNQGTTQTPNTPPVIIGNNDTTTKTNTVGDPSVKNEKLPQTGEMDILLVGVGAALALVVVGLFIKVKLMDNQMKH